MRKCERLNYRFMEFKKEYACCNFINDEVIISDPEDEKVSESCLLEKGEKVTDLGEVKNN